VSKLVGSLGKVEDLSQSERHAMLLLMQKYYDNVAEEDFYRDLEEKELAIIMRDSLLGEIRGFSTIMCLDVRTGDQPVRAVFSGDTIVERDFWGENWLVRILGGYFMDLIEKYPLMKLYWFLICKGYKTYRYLPLCFRKFYPCFYAETPRAEKTIIDLLALLKYPDKYDTSEGIIRSRVKAARLKRGVADIVSERLKNPHIDFFSRKNPGHIKGDELACIAELGRDNFSDLFYRIVLGRRWRILKDEIPEAD